MSAFWILLRREINLALREGGAIGTALGFYLLVVALMPLGLGPDLNLLSRIAPGVLWISLLLAALLSLGRLFETDRDAGTLDVFANGPLPLEVVTIAKAAAHWLTTAIPLAILAPILGLLLNLDVAIAPWLVATMLIGTPAISFLGAIGAALTLGSRRGGLLLALIVLPLYVPTLIFGISAISALQGPDGATASLLILGAISLAAVVLSPLAAAAALRIHLQ